MPSPLGKLGPGARTWAAALGLAALACATAPAGPKGNPEAGERYRTGEDLLQARRFDEAARELERAAELAPGWAPAHVELGWARFHAGALEGAEAAFRVAAGLDPGEPGCHRGLGSALYAQGRYGEAAPELERWLDLTGGPARAWDAAILWALSLRRAGGASAARAAELLEHWTSPSNRFVDYSGTAAASHVLEGPARTLGEHLLGEAAEEEVVSQRWGGDARRAFAGYAVAANLLVRGKAAGARERLAKLAEAAPEDDLSILVTRAFARADLRSLP